MPSQDNDLSPETALSQAIARDQRWFFGGVIAFVLVLGIVGGVGWGHGQQIGKSTNQQSSEISKSANQQASEPVKSATPAPEIMPVFAVWNGSGVAGAAGKLAEKLKAAGYEVIETKNAPSEQTGTTIEISAQVVSQKEAILELVGGGNYQPLRDESLEYSVKVIIGK